MCLMPLANLSGNLSHASDKISGHDLLLGTDLLFLLVALPWLLILKRVSLTWCLEGNSPPPIALSIMAVLSSEECCVL